MSATQNLLVELLVEELPPKALPRLMNAFGGDIHWVLNRHGLVGDVELDVNYKLFATPRRLAVWVKDVASQAPEQVRSVKLMPVSVALSVDGTPTPALLKKLAALGADASAVSGLKRVSDSKSEVLLFESVVPGATLVEALQQALAEAIAKLPIPKVMSYQLADGWTSVDFVRPAHGLVALHGSEVVPVRALGLVAGRTTHGHRFEAATPAIELRDADSYAAQLRDAGAVIASFAERHAEIVRQLDAAAAEAGLKPIDDDALLDEVTALVERPNVLVCRFDRAFLDVPPECLILTMKANQKYFPLLDAEGRLTERFLVVSNIRPADPGRVVGGNERVVRPRLSDAKFFFDQDRKKTLASRLPGLDKVVYHGKLGSQGERVQRVRSIARAIGEAIGGTALAEQADRAAQLAKADLLTDMVGEFPELQGIMGRYYALHDGEPEDVAYAIEDHYRPRFAGDALPRSRVGVVVALADKLETLVGLFGIGQAPTGDKDPFALRRHALGVSRLLIENGLALELPWLIERAAMAFTGVSGVDADIVKVAEFVYDRLAGQLREQGYSALEIDAVLSQRPARLADVPARLAAVRAFAGLPEAPALAAANKRVGNILKKADRAVAARVDAALLKEPAEAALYEALNDVGPKAAASFERGDYAPSLQALAALKSPVDAFFDAVMVNADDPALRANRLGLLATLHAAMNRVADLSKLAA
ncbi:MAG: glycine--tRNA ligase subunit beta [Proteobacteria bacterium]|nr:glycine--tRNA ligase subunit beta [Pseudomonadota bacterium]